MKRHMLAFAVLGVMFGFTGVPAHAQSGIRVKVPFQFVVADKTLPEGQYLILSAKDSVFVQNSQGKTVAVVLSNGVSGRSIGKTGQVVFQCYGQQCFLSEVWIPTQDTGRQLLKSRREIEVARKEAPKYFALVATPNEQK